MEKNIYKTTSDIPEMIDSFVCYADILGYAQLSRAAMNAGEGVPFLKHLRSALTAAYQSIRKRGVNRKQHLFFIKVFTDNIVIGYPLTNPDIDQGEQELAEMFDIFMELQVTLAMQGFFLRGGIARGLHYMDNDIVFGDALLEAVSLDKSGAPPRLTLAPSVVQTVQKQLGDYGGAVDHHPQYEHVLEDADGTLFLNYLGEAFFAFHVMEIGILFDVIITHKQSVINGLTKYKAVPDIRAKYEWVARYHNFVCREFAERHPIPSNPDADERTGLGAVQAQKLLDHIIDVESLAAGPKRLTLQPIESCKH